MRCWYAEYLDFEKDYPAKVVSKEENYRSTKPFQAANEVIKNNKKSIVLRISRPKRWWWTNHHHRANDEIDEAAFVARTIDESSVKTPHKDLQFLSPRSPTHWGFIKSTSLIHGWRNQVHNVQTEILSLLQSYCQFEWQYQWININEPKRNWARYSWENPWSCEYARYVRARCFQPISYIWHHG